MVKEIVKQIAYCDLCGKEITDSIFSPIWGELKPDGDGNYDRDGDIIGVDICGGCKDRAEKRILRDILHPEEKATENDKNSEKKVKKSYGRGHHSNLDDGKIMALRRAGWSMAKIAEEFGVSSVTIGKHIRRMEEGTNEDYD